MSKFRVWFTATASTSIVVEAEDEAEAYEVAHARFDYPGVNIHNGFDLGEWEADEDVDLEED